MTRPGWFQITPEPELPREPRTSTTPPAASLVSSARPVEMVSAPAPSSVSRVTMMAFLVWPRARRDADVVQDAAAYDANGSQSTDHFWTEGHLQRLAVFDRAPADGQDDVAQQAAPLLC